MIATGPIGGPGKGLFQFLKHAPANAFDYVLCNFDVRYKPGGSQFVTEAQRNGFNLVLLRQRLTIDPYLVLQARRMAVEHGINLIQTHAYKSNVIGFLLKVLCGLPWIGFAHGYTDDNPKVRIYNRIDRAVLRYADRVVAVSHAMKTLLIKHGLPAEKIQVIYNGIDKGGAAFLESSDTIRQRHGLSPKQKIVGVIGRLNPEKGQMVFLKAMEQTALKCPEARALLLGDGQERALLERYCHEHGLGDRVIFTGYRENIADYYQLFDLLVLPSLSEGLPNVALEAMSFGIPVLATAVGGVPEVIQNGNGILVPPGDPEALSERMTELLGNHSLRQTIGLKGKDSLYPRFSPTHRARQILNLYAEVLS